MRYCHLLIHRVQRQVRIAHELLPDPIDTVRSVDRPQVRKIILISLSCNSPFHRFLRICRTLGIDGCKIRFINILDSADCERRSLGTASDCCQVVRA